MSRFRGVTLYGDMGIHAKSTAGTKNGRQSYILVCLRQIQYNTSEIDVSGNLDHSQH